MILNLNKFFVLSALLFSSPVLFAEELGYPVAFKINRIETEKVELIAVKNPSEKCLITKQDLKESNYQARFNEAVWVQADNNGRMTCKLISLEVYNDYQGRLKRKTR